MAAYNVGESPSTAGRSTSVEDVGLVDFVGVAVCRSGEEAVLGREDVVVDTGTDNDCRPPPPLLASRFRKILPKIFFAALGDAVEVLTGSLGVWWLIIPCSWSEMDSPDEQGEWDKSGVPARLPLCPGGARDECAELRRVGTPREFGAGQTLAPWGCSTLVLWGCSFPSHTSMGSRMPRSIISRPRLWNFATRASVPASRIVLVMTLCALKLYRGMMRRPEADEAVDENEVTEPEEKVVVDA